MTQTLETSTPSKPKRRIQTGRHNSRCNTNEWREVHRAQNDGLTNFNFEGNSEKCVGLQALWGPGENDDQCTQATQHPG